MPNSTEEVPDRPDYLRGDLTAEYYRLADIVAGLDQRLLTVKSWGVEF